MERFFRVLRTIVEKLKETEFEIDSVEIHVVSNLNNELRPPFRDDIIWLEKDNLRIPCMSLESELSFYEKIHREKDKGKVKLIKQKLNK